MIQKMTDYEARILSELDSEGRDTKSLRDYLWFKTLYEEMKEEKWERAR